eukprot:1196148-Prorocentrum_minimum.AAC.1
MLSTGIRFVLDQRKYAKRARLVTAADALSSVLFGYVPERGLNRTLDRARIGRWAGPQVWAELLRASRKQARSYFTNTGELLKQCCAPAKCPPDRPPQSETLPSLDATPVPAGATGGDPGEPCAVYSASTIGCDTAGAGPVEASGGFRAHGDSAGDEPGSPVRVLDFEGPQGVWGGDGTGTPHGASGPAGARGAERPDAEPRNRGGGASSGLGEEEIARGDGVFVASGGKGSGGAEN